MTRFVFASLVRLASAGLSVLVATLCAFVDTPAQPSKLVLTGSVVKTGVRCINDKPVAEIITYFQFRNDGDETLLLIMPAAPLLETKLEFADSSRGSGKRSTFSVNSFVYNPYLENPFGKATVEDYDPVPRFLYALDSATIPSRNMIAVAPGAYHEFRNTLWPESGFRIEAIKGASAQACEPSSYTAAPEHLSFRVVFRLAINSRADGLLARLRDRLRRFGTLVMTDRGDVVYRSEEIVLDPSSKN